MRGGRAERDGFEENPLYLGHAVSALLKLRAIALRAIPLIRRCFATTPSPARGKESASNL